jgi:hypothetical protein
MDIYGTQYRTGMIHWTRIIFFLLYSKPTQPISLEIDSTYKPAYLELMKELLKNPKTATGIPNALLRT